MHRLITLTLLVLITTPLLSAPATRPSDEIPALLRQLSHDDWKMRQQAQERLVSVGDPAVEPLKRVLRETKDEEVRALAEATLRQIAQNDRTGPTLITLHLKDAPLQTALEEVSRQAKVEVGLWPPNLVQHVAAKVTIDADRQPFWMVMRTLCDQTGLGLERSGQRHRITLVQRAEPWSRRPYSTHGVFMIVANTLQRNHSVDFAVPDRIATSFNMHFHCLVDPKAKAVQGTTMVQIDEVVDDRGNSLAPPPNRFVAPSMSSPGWGSNWMWDHHAQLQYRPDMGKRIAHLRGSVRFLVQDKTDVWEIDDIANAKSPERAIPIGKYTIAGFRKVGIGYELSINIEHAATAAPHQNPLTDYASIQRGIRLFDAAGNAYEQSGGGGGGGGGRLQYTINFNRPHDHPNNKPFGEPKKLVWEIPTELKEVTVPIVLRDLPIP